MYRNYPTIFYMERLKEATMYKEVNRFLTSSNMYCVKEIDAVMEEFKSQKEKMIMRIQVLSCIVDQKIFDESLVNVKYTLKELEHLREMYIKQKEKEERDIK
jgi:hypothetical protein